MIQVGKICDTLRLSKIIWRNKMKTLRIERFFYNGIIHPFSRISDSIQYEVKEDTIIATIEREYYGHETESHKHYKINGTFDLIDNYIEILDNEEKLQYFTNFKENIIEFAKQLQDGYKDEYFINSVPHCLDYTIVEIDGKKYKFGNINCNDELYELPKEMMYNDPLMGLPTKLLCKILPMIDTNKN